MKIAVTMHALQRFYELKFLRGERMGKKDFTALYVRNSKSINREFEEFFKEQAGNVVAVFKRKGEIIAYTSIYIVLNIADKLTFSEFGEKVDYQLMTITQALPSFDERALGVKERKEIDLYNAILVFPKRIEER